MDIAEILRKNIKHISQVWLKRARENIKVSGTVSDEQFIDSLPDFLDVIAEMLSNRNKDEEARRRAHICRQHAEQRHALPDYTLEMVMHELQLLQQTIFEVLRKETEISGEQSRVISESIFSGVRETAVIFISLEFEVRDKALAQSQEAVNRLHSEQQLREQFVQTLTHDLRNPLSAARVSAQLLLRDPAQELRHSLAAKIIAHLDRVDGMIANLLDVGAITAGKGLKLNIRPLDMNDVITRVVEDMTTIHGTRVQYERDGEVTGYWDEFHLRRAIDNLADNAIKYGWHHTPITIRLQSRDERVIMSVHNFGAPISENEIKALFMPFTRTKSAQEGPQRGWGLGLPLTKGIVEAHGGTLSVSSSEKDGTTFTIDLPRDCRHVPEKVYAMESST
jgi:signal transduction histidine kinase